MKLHPLHYAIIAIVIAAGAYIALGPAQDAPLAVAQGAGSTQVLGYAWSDNIGWISMNCKATKTDTCTQYGVALDKTNGNKLSGYGWSDNVGWVSFNAADVAGCQGGGQCQAWLDTSTTPNWTLKGWAKVVSADQALKPGETKVWDGFISLSGTAVDESVYGVQIDPDTSKAADVSSNKAWGSHVVGWVDFAPKVNGSLIDNRLSFEPPLSENSLALSASNTVMPVKQGVQMIVTVMKKEAVDTSKAGKRVTLTASNGALINDSPAAVSVTIGSNGTASFTLKNNTAGLTDVTAVPVDFASESGTKSMTFAGIRFNSEPTLPVSNTSTAVPIEWTLTPKAMFQTTNTCTKTDDWSTDAWAGANTNNITRQLFTPRLPENKLGLTCRLADGREVVSDKLTTRLSDIPVITVSANPSALATTNTQTNVSWTIASDTNLKDCVATSPTGFNPVITNNPGSGSSMFTLPATEGAYTFAIQCANGSGTGKGETVVTVGSATPSDASVYLNVKDGSVSYNPTTKKISAILEWATEKMDAAWSCKGSLPSGDTTWFNKSLVWSGGESGVTTPGASGINYSILCTKGTENVTATTFVTTNSKPALTVKTATTSITFVSNKKELSTKLSLKLKPNGVQTTNVIFSKSPQSKFTPKLRLIGATDAGAPTLTMGKSDAENSGFQLWYELTPDQVLVPAGKAFADYKAWIRITSESDQRVYTDVPIVIRVQNFIPNYNEI